MNIIPKNRIPNYKDFVETVDIYTTRRPTRVSRSEIASPSNKLLENDDFTYEPTEYIYLTTSPTCNSTYMTMPPTQLPLISTDNANTYDKNMYYATISVSGVCFFIVFITIDWGIVQEIWPGGARSTNLVPEFCGIPSEIDRGVIQLYPTKINL
jgi:hypothetical protein